MERRLWLAALVLLTVLGAADASRAAWQSPGTGAQAAKAITLGTGATPSASVTNRSVALSWSATGLPGGGSVGGYTVRRYSTAGVLQSIGSGCSGTVAATSCTETGLPAGSWRYTVTPRQGNWAGSEGSQSSAVTVAAASLTVTSGTPVGSLPATVNATLAAFVPGQTVVYRLDNATTGTLLTATTTPSTIPAGAGATAAITIPAGTTGGAHTIYAIGSGGDVASAAISVDSSVTTGAWKISDVSSGAAVDASAEQAFAGDSLVARTGRWTNAFTATRYLEADMSAPLPAGQTVAGANFAFRFAAEGATHTACFYFEVRRASTGAVLATHGSAAAPVGCVTGTAQTGFTTGLPELSTSALANDARVRVFVSQSSFRTIDVDQATIMGTAGLTAFTLYPRTWTDASTGTAATTTLPLAAEDGTAFQPAANWETAFSATNYVEVGFPAHVPSGATIRSATLRHVWRPANGAKTICWYAESWTGGSLLASHGSAAAPLSCRTGAVYGADTLALGAVNTPARANDLKLRIYARVTAGGGNRRSEHDVFELTVRYGN
jgi:hypothetical protein